MMTALVDALPVNAPIRVRTHSADGATVEHVGVSVAEALAAADLSTRKGRIAAIVRAAEALLVSGDPALVFVGSALAAWLETDRGRGSMIAVLRSASIDLDCTEAERPMLRAPLDSIRRSCWIVESGH